MAFTELHIWDPPIKNTIKLFTWPFIVVKPRVTTLQTVWPDWGILKDQGYNISYVQKVSQIIGKNIKFQVKIDVAVYFLWKN